MRQKKWIWTEKVSLRKTFFHDSQKETNHARSHISRNVLDDFFSLYKVSFIRKKDLKVQNKVSFLIRGQQRNLRTYCLVKGFALCIHLVPTVHHPEETKPTQGVCPASPQIQWFSAASLPQLNFKAQTSIMLHCLMWHDLSELSVAVCGSLLASWETLLCVILCVGSKVGAAMLNLEKEYARSLYKCKIL